MWPYTCMILIFYSTPAVFFWDSTMYIYAGPSSGLSSRGGQKPEGGATFLKYCIGCMQEPRGQTWNGGHRFEMGGPGATGPPAGDDPVFMTTQLHFSHTRVECETRFSAGWQLQTTIRCRLRILGQRKIATLLSGHPNGDTQLFNLGTVSFTHTKRRGVFKFTNKSNISIGISGLCD